MEYVLIAVAFVLLIVGVCACVVPVLPGPLVAFLGLLCLLKTPYPPATAGLVVFGVLTFAVGILDNVIPALGAKSFDCTRWGTVGCFIGTLVGLFFFPFGLLLGPFLGALAGELIARRTFMQALRGSLGALLGFLAGVVLKTCATSAMLIYAIYLLVASA